MNDPLIEAVHVLKSSRLNRLIIDFRFQPGARTSDEIVAIVRQAYTEGLITGEFLEGERNMLLGTLGQLASLDKTTCLQLLRAVDYLSEDFEEFRVVFNLTVRDVQQEFSDAVV